MIENFRGFHTFRKLMIAFSVQKLPQRDHINSLTRICHATVSNLLCNYEISNFHHFLTILKAHISTINCESELILGTVLETCFGTMIIIQVFENAINSSL